MVEATGDRGSLVLAFEQPEVADEQERYARRTAGIGHVAGSGADILPAFTSTSFRGTYIYGYPPGHFLG